jgi:hypothetical protein
MSPDKRAAETPIRAHRRDCYETHPLQRRQRELGRNDRMPVYVEGHLNHAFGHADRRDARGTVERSDRLAPRRGGEHVPHRRGVHRYDGRVPCRPDGLELARDDGGNTRSAALGLLLVTVGLLSARYERSP